MKLAVADDLDARLAELYFSKVTVNLDAKSTITPNEFWNSMELIAINNKAVMNFRTKK